MLMGQAGTKRRHRFGWIVAVIASVAGLAYWGSGRETAKHWNAVHDLARRADAAKNLDVPDDALAILACMDHDLAGLSVAGVDPLAIEAANRFRAVVLSARRCLERGIHLRDHPVRAAALSAVGVVSGDGPLVNLRDDLEHLRDESLDAYQFAESAHRTLRHRYFLNHFSAPIPPDVHLIDEVLRELDRLDRADRNLTKWAYRVSLVVAAVLGGM